MKMDDVRAKLKNEQVELAGLSPPRLPPNLKHGSYSTFTVLPGENAKEYGELHQKLVKELLPDGPLEENAVKTIAQCVWRINNFSVFGRAKLARTRYHPDVQFTLLCSQSAAKRELDKEIAGVKDALSPEKLKKFEALRKERDFVLQEGHTIMNVGATLRDHAVKQMVELGESLGVDFKYLLESSEVEYELAWLGDVVTLEHLDLELKILKRLEARISRAMKTLMQAKAIKQIMGTAPTSPSLPQPPQDSASAAANSTTSGNNTSPAASEAANTAPMKEGSAMPAGTEKAPTREIEIEGRKLTIREDGLLARLYDGRPEVIIETFPATSPTQTASDAAPAPSQDPPEDSAATTTSTTSSPRSRSKPGGWLKVPPGSEPANKALRRAARELDTSAAKRFGERGVEPPDFADQDDIDRAIREYHKKAPPKK